MKLLMAFIAINIISNLPVFAEVDQLKQKLDSNLRPAFEQLIEFYNQGVLPAEEDLIGIRSGKSFYIDHPNTPISIILICMDYPTQKGHDPLLNRTSLNCDGFLKQNSPTFYDFPDLDKIRKDIQEIFATLQDALLIDFTDSKACRVYTRPIYSLTFCFRMYEKYLIQTTWYRVTGKEQKKEKEEKDIIFMAYYFKNHGQ